MTISDTIITINNSNNNIEAGSHPHPEVSHKARNQQQPEPSLTDQASNQSLSTRARPRQPQRPQRQPRPRAITPRTSPDPNLFTTLRRPCFTGYPNSPRPRSHLILTTINTITIKASPSMTTSSTGRPPVPGASTTIRLFHTPITGTGLSTPPPTGSTHPGCFTRDCRNNPLSLISKLRRMFDLSVFK